MRQQEFLIQFIDQIVIPWLNSDGTISEVKDALEKGACSIAENIEDYQMRLERTVLGFTYNSVHGGLSADVEECGLPCLSVLFEIGGAAIKYSDERIRRKFIHDHPLKK